MVVFRIITLIKTASNNPERFHTISTAVDITETSCKQSDNHNFLSVNKGASNTNSLNYIDILNLSAIDRRNLCIELMHIDFLLSTGGQNFLNVDFQIDFYNLIEKQIDLTLGFIKANNFRLEKCTMLTHLISLNNNIENMYAISNDFIKKTFTKHKEELLEYTDDNRMLKFYLNYSTNEQPKTKEPVNVIENAEAKSAQEELKKIFASKSMEILKTEVSAAKQRIKRLNMFQKEHPYTYLKFQLRNYLLEKTETLLYIMKFYINNAISSIFLKYIEHDFLMPKRKF